MSTHVCDVCKGQGYVMVTRSDENGQYPDQEQCSDCGGTGDIEESPLRAATSRDAAEIARLTAENAELRKRVGLLRRGLLRRHYDTLTIQAIAAASTASMYGYDDDEARANAIADQYAARRRSLLTGGNDNGK